MRMGVHIAVSLMLISTTWAWAGPIYTWTGEDGVKRFSDLPPPSGKDYSVIDTPSTPSEGSEGRSEYDRMIQELREENQRNDQMQRRKVVEDQRQPTAREIERRNEVQTQVQELQSRIDALNNRALSPTFTQGMRQNQIEALQKEMEQLQKSVEDSP